MLRNGGPVVSIGIDAAVVADHRVAIRGLGVRDDFRVPPTLAGMSKSTERLRPHAGAPVVVEPTAGTWLPLTIAVTAAGCRIGFVQNRDPARLRSAISGRNKTDVIAADMLARCEDILGVHDAPVPLVGQVGLRRALTRRHHMVVDAHRAECRLWARPGRWNRDLDCVPARSQRRPPPISTPCGRRWRTASCSSAHTMSLRSSIRSPVVPIGRARCCGAATALELPSRRCDRRSCSGRRTRCRRACSWCPSAIAAGATSLRATETR